MNHILQILNNIFNIQAERIKKIDGYANKNYIVETAKAKYILKEYIFEQEHYDFLVAESEILNVLSKKLPCYFQKIYPDQSNHFVIHNENNMYRLISFLEGDLLASVSHTKKLLTHFGKVLAETDLILQKLNLPVIKARQYEWDILQIDLSKKYFKEIKNPADRKLVEYFYLQYNEEIRPLVPELRKSIIHADANDYNVLVKDNKISGIIDFGDSVYSLLINELAVAAVYVMFHKENPLEAAVPLIKGYNQIIKLEEKELDILYYLIAARLCISVSQAAHEKKRKPDDEYITISEKPAWELLRKWIKINPLEAKNVFRKAAGMGSIFHQNINDVLKKRNKNISNSLSLSYKQPIKMYKAAFQYMYDTEGNTYLDMRNNIPHVGHSHPSVVRAGQRQMAKLNTNTRYLYDELSEYSELLLSKFPENLNKIFFVNSGSAASDLAIRLALAHTKKEKIAVMEHGYHGNTHLGINISHYKFAGKGGNGTPENIIIAKAPDTYRGKYTYKETAGKSYAFDFINAAKTETNRIAAFIAEPIISAAGQIPLPEGYLPEIYKFIRKQGGVCISDEVQTGFGRSGTYFWMYEASEVVPDIVIIGKPMGNGHPMAAVVCTGEIAQSFENGMEFFSSFGGNPVSCAIGIELLNVLEKESLVQNAFKIGNYLIEQLHELQKSFPVIGDIRGTGLNLGIDFIKSPDTKKENTELAGKIVNQLRKKGILTGTDGPFDNVLKIKPPMCFTKENVDFFIKEMEKALQ
ncbi:MAG: aminotransferase class III-fold pyridoxal phosphate-dependent enzyme [Bacteroidales bacterium]|nr:aminotransferase class III-fold pyridoxal phosphate-dependent enzyme [Bacteroidales bacterium]